VQVYFEKLTAGLLQGGERGMQSFDNRHKYYL
jgi:hypothetical protein